MYCTDFCSALHQEMQGYVRVSPAGSNVPLTYSLNNKADNAKKPCENSSHKINF